MGWYLQASGSFASSPQLRRPRARPVAPFATYFANFVRTGNPQAGRDVRVGVHRMGYGGVPEHLLDYLVVDSALVGVEPAASNRRR